jgi:hypothetical protein
LVNGPSTASPLGDLPLASILIDTPSV